MKPERFSSRPGKVESHLKQMGSPYRRDKNLQHINAVSQDDFETKFFQSYHVIKSNQKIQAKIKRNFRMWLINRMLLLNKNLHINAASQDDFETKSLKLSSIVC